MTYEMGIQFSVFSDGEADDTLGQPATRHASPTPRHKAILEHFESEGAHELADACLHFPDEFDFERAGAHAFPLRLSSL
jgi:hypothetical protein